MFNDGRSKRVVFIAHCLLNQNSISDGTAVYPAAFKSIIDFFLNADIGIVQMPCPEFCCLGLDRGNINGAYSSITLENTRIRREMKKCNADKTLSLLVDHVMQQIFEYHEYGFEIAAIIGVNRSPSCGIETTSDYDMEIDGMGLFMEKIFERLSLKKISIPMIGVKSIDDIDKKFDFIKSVVR